MLEYTRDYVAVKAELMAKVNTDVLSPTQLRIKESTIDHKVSLLKESERQEKSFIGILGHAIEPAIRPLGFDWKIGVSLITGAAAKEIVVSTMGVLYQSDPEQEEAQSLASRLQSAKHTSGPKTGQLVYTPPVAFGFLMFVLFYFPCIAVIAAIKRESGQWKYALFEVVYTTAIAWVVAFASYQIGNLFY